MDASGKTLLTTMREKALERDPLITYVKIDFVSESDVVSVLLSNN